MKEIVDTLVEIEEKANHILRNVTRTKIQMEKDMNNKMVEYDEQIMSDTQVKIEDLRKKFEEETEPERLNLFDKNEKHLRKLNTDFFENQGKIVDNIFHKIIGA